MFLLMLGVAILGCLLFALRSFERAPIASVHALLKWIAALGGILLTLGLVVSGRGVPALIGLVLVGPALWQRWRESRPPEQGPRPRPRRSSGAMSRAEALEVLGLKPGACEDDIHAAHRRLMRMAHPDTGGSDWLASRINQARDVLLG